MRDKHIHNLKFPMRIKVYDEDAMHDIHTFEINSSKDNIFISDNKDMEFCIKDCQYLIIYGQTMEQIIEDVYNKGIEEGKRLSKPKKIIKEENFEE